MTCTSEAVLTNAPSVIWIQLVIGVIGLFATWWFFYRWSRHPERAAAARKLYDNTAGGSIRRAQVALDEIARFEQE